MNHLSPLEDRGKVPGLCFFLSSGKKWFQLVTGMACAGAPLHVELITDNAESKSHRFSLSLAFPGLFSIHEMCSQSSLRSWL